MSQNLSVSEYLEREKPNRVACFYFDDHFPVGNWVKLKPHQTRCDCLEKCTRTGICPKLYLCSCYEYTYLNRICYHIVKIDRTLTSAQKTLYGERSISNSICIDDIIRMMTACKNDVFPYESFFKNNLNFVLRLNERKRILHWDGYEHVLKRHEMGKSFEEEQITQIGSKNWKIRAMKRSEREMLKKKNDVESKRRLHIFGQMSNAVNFISRRCKYDCRSFKKCRACLCCIHMYSCDCDDYLSGFFCQHCHAVVIKRFDLQNYLYELKNETYYYRDEDSRNFFLNMCIRLRHNAALFMKCVEKEHSVYVYDGIFNKDGSHFQVLKSKEKCDCDESRKCLVCNICCHSLKCPCIDYERGFICSHMHAAQMLFLKMDWKLDRLMDNLEYRGYVKTDSSSNYFSESETDSEQYELPGPSGIGNTEIFLASQKDELDKSAKSVAASDQPEELANPFIDEVVKPQTRRHSVSEEKSDIPDKWAIVIPAFDSSDKIESHCSYIRDINHQKLEYVFPVRVESAYVKTMCPEYSETSALDEQFSHYTWEVETDSEGETTEESRSECDSSSTLIEQEVEDSDVETNDELESNDEDESTQQSEGDGVLSSLHCEQDVEDFTAVYEKQESDDMVDDSENETVESQCESEWFLSSDEQETEKGSDVEGLNDEAANLKIEKAEEPEGKSAQSLLDHERHIEKDLEIDTNEKHESNNEVKDSNNQQAEGLENENERSLLGDKRYIEILDGETDEKQESNNEVKDSKNEKTEETKGKSEQSSIGQEQSMKKDLDAEINEKLKSNNEIEDSKNKKSEELGIDDRNNENDNINNPNPRDKGI